MLVDTSDTASVAERSKKGNTERCRTELNCCTVRRCWVNVTSHYEFALIRVFERDMSLAPGAKLRPFCTDKAPKQYTRIGSSHKCQAL